MAFLVPFAPEHLARMAVREDARKISEIPGIADIISKLDAKSILNTDGTVIAVIGVTPTLPGVCEVFVVASDDQKRFPTAFARGVRKELHNLRSKYRRIQAVTETGAFYKRFVSWLGFTEEGVLRKYGLDGQDMVMWSLTQ